MNLIQFRSKIVVKTLDMVGWMWWCCDQPRSGQRSATRETLWISEGRRRTFLLFVYFNKQHTVENGETTNTSITAIMLELIAVMWCYDKFHRSWYGCPRHKRPCVAAKVSCFLIEHQTNHCWLFKRDQKHTCFGKLKLFKEIYTKLVFSP